MKKLKTSIIPIIFLLFFYAHELFALDKLGIYTGTFDPPHMAHQAIVDTILLNDLVDEIYVVPDDKTPFKPNKSSIDHRMNMVKILFKDNKKVKFLTEVMQNEIKSGEMWNVMETIRKYNPKKTISIVMGADVFAKYTKFHSSFSDKNFSLIIVKRGDEVKIPSNFEGQTIKQIVLNLDDVSSTKIRDEIKNGEKPKEINVKVFDYIIENNLYLK